MFAVEINPWFPYPFLRPLTLTDCIDAVRGDENAPVEAHRLLVDYPVFAACITYGCYISPPQDSDTVLVDDRPIDIPFYR